jgi:hypothetical protein
MSLYATNLPIAHVISQILSQHYSTPVESVEVHIKRIYDPISLVCNNDNTGSSSIRLSIGIGLDTIEESWVLCDITVRREKDVGPILPKQVELIEIIQSKWRSRGHFGKALLWRRVCDLCGQIGWQVWFLGVQVYQRCCAIHISIVFGRSQSLSTLAYHI